MGLEEFGGGGSEKFWGVGGVLWGSKEFWEVGGVFGGGGPEGVLGGRRSLGGVEGVLGEATGVWGDGRWSLGGLGGGVKGVWGGGQRSLGDTWFSGETEGGSVVANREKRGDCRKLTARE